MAEVLSTKYPIKTPLVQLGVLVGIDIIKSPASGNGHIKGVLMLKSVPEPLAVVDIYEEESGMKVASVVTDATGSYRFDNLDTSLKYFLIAKEKSGLWEYRVQSRITPVL